MPMQVWMNELNGKLRKRLRISFQLPSRTCPKFQAETASCVPPDGARSRRLITGLEMRMGSSTVQRVGSGEDPACGHFDGRCRRRLRDRRQRQGRCLHWQREETDLKSTKNAPWLKNRELQGYRSAAKILNGSRDGSTRGPSAAVTNP